MNDQGLEDAAVTQVAVYVAVSAAAEVDVEDRVERAGDGQGLRIITDPRYYPVKVPFKPLTTVNGAVNHSITGLLG